MANGQLLGCSQFDYPGNDIKPPAQDEMTHRIVDLELRSGPVSVKMTVAITHQGAPLPFSFMENAFGHAFLSTHFTESLACVDYGPVSSAAAQIS